MQNQIEPISGYYVVCNRQTQYTTRAQNDNGRQQGPFNIFNQSNPYNGSKLREKRTDKKATHSLILYVNSNFFCHIFRFLLPIGLISQVSQDLSDCNAAALIQIITCLNTKFKYIRASCKHCVNTQTHIMPSP